MHHVPRQYLDWRMEAIEKAVKATDTIPSAYKEGWIARIHAGDEALLSLLITQLHCLASNKPVMDDERSIKANVRRVRVAILQLLLSLRGSLTAGTVMCGRMWEN